MRVAGAAGPYLAACVLLAFAGSAKLRRPAAAQRALAGLGLRALAVPAWAVRAAGMAELVLGTTAMVAAGAGPALLIALCYLAFAAFVIASLVGGGGGDCGCFGETAEAVPLGVTHAAMNALLAAAALIVAAGGGLEATLVERSVLVASAAGLAWVVYLVLVPLPQLMLAVRRARR